MTVEFVEKLNNNQRYEQTSADKVLPTTSGKQADRLRRDINRSQTKGKKTLIRCAFCHEPLYLRANSFDRGGYHFCHFRTDDPVLKKCPQRTESSSRLDQNALRALKYGGAKESTLHFRLKHIIARLLLSDSSVEEESVKVEATLKNEGEWRKPDVQAIHNERLIAFEVQVSTEMAPMIALREIFYEQFGHIIWILPNFSPDEINQSQRDILTSNNDHLFVLDKEMRRLSFEKKCLHLKAWIDWPYLQDGKLHREWREETVALGQIDFVEGHAQYLDVSAEEKLINDKIGAHSQSNPKSVGEFGNYRAPSPEFLPTKNHDLVLWWDRWINFTEYLISPDYKYFFRDELEKDMQNSHSSQRMGFLWLQMHGITIQQCDCSQFVIRALLCASKGRLDYRYSSWKYIASQLLINHPQWFSAFHRILRVNNHISILDTLESDSDFLQKKNEFKRSPKMLNKAQKMLAACIAPELKAFVEIKALTLLERSFRQDFRFQYSVLNSDQPGKEIVYPEPISFTHYTHKKRYSEMGKDLKYTFQNLVEQGWEIPFPNIPILGNPVHEFLLSEDDSAVVLEVWDKQLSKLEDQLYSIRDKTSF